MATVALEAVITSGDNPGDQGYYEQDQRLGFMGAQTEREGLGRGGAIIFLVSVFWQELVGSSS